MKLTKAADRVASYGPQTETTDLWATIIGDKRAATALADLGRELRSMPVAELEKVPHLGPVRAAMVFAVIELGRRMRAAPLKRGNAIHCVQDIVNAYGTRLMDLERESVWAVYLDIRNRVITDEMHAIGSIDHCPVNVRDVLRTALRVAAPGMILLHTHPNSGDPQPSSEDDGLTRALVGAGKIVGVQVLDHIVVGDAGEYFSYAEHGRLNLE